MIKNTAEVQGTEIHWLQLGKRSSAPPVILLHGLNDCSQTWLHIAEVLAHDRQVLVPDLPGHGFSSRPDASYTLDWYAWTISEWLKSLDIPQADIMGHSFGGGIAQVMLLLCRERIRRLILVSSGGLGREISVFMRLASVPLLVEKLGQPFMGIGTTIALHLARDGRKRSDIAILSRMNSRQGSARAFSRTVRDIINWRGQRRVYSDRVHEISDLPPILLLWGKGDSIIPARHATHFTSRVSNVRIFVFDGCGHYPHFQKRDLFLTKVVEFLNDAGVPHARLNTSNLKSLGKIPRFLR
jgi:pimeloyl-ACP methyl ester carboxylesterase